ncbi:retrovirus-related pol polyprotein from transposon TNT 1-94 [Tanacetum coccineum]
MEESQLNKFKADKLRVLLVLETEELLQHRGETIQLFKDKLMLAKAQEASQILDEEQLAFIADPRIAKVQVAQQTIPQNSAFETEDLDAYDSDCDDISSAKAVLMENLSSCDSDVLSEESQDAGILDTNSHAPNDLSVLSLVEQMNDHVANIDKENQTNKIVNKSLTAELERYKERVTIFKQRINVAFWLKHSNYNPDTFVKSHTPIRIEAPSELPKITNYCDMIFAMRKNVVDTAVSKPNATIAPGMFKLDIEPISHRLKNNRDAHEVYIEKTIENTNTLCGFVERAKTQNPSEPLIESTCTFTKQVQELLVYVSQTCPNSPKPSEKLVVVTPTNKEKRVRIFEPITSLSNIPKQIDSLKTKDSNKPLLTSTREKPTTSASGLKPSGNTKNNRITRPPSSNQKNKVEDHSRKVVQIVLWYLDSDCSKHMTKNHSQLIYFVSKFLGTVRFGNDHIAKIMVYGDYQIGNVTISWVYYVEGLGHNLFFVGQFCDSDLEVAFCKHTCFIRDLDGVDLLKGSRGSNLYTLSMDNLLLSSPICLLSKASKTKSWLWHRRLSHLNFDYINSLAKQGLVRGLLKLKYQKDHLCSACALGKSKKHSHKPKAEDSIQEKLYLLHMDLCGPMRVQSINGRKYILVIVDDFSRFTWVKFLRSKDEVLDVIKFLKMIQVRLNATVRNIRTDNGTEFVNQTLRDYYEEVRISHQTSVARTPQQNGVVERQNRTLVEAARTMLIFSKALLFLWAEAVATACYTQNRSLIRKHHNKTPYELLHDQKPDLSYLHVFGALCYPTNDGEDLGKLKPKADIGIFVGYAPAKKAFRIYNKRTRMIIETIHVDFDELTAMASKQFSSGPGPKLLTPGTISSGLVPNIPSSTPYVPPTKNDWEILFQPMFDEYLNPPPCVDPQVLVVIAPEPAVSTDTPPTIAHMDNNPFVEFPIPEPSFEESSTQVVIPNHVHLINQPPEHINKWTKDHLIDNVIGVPSRAVST